MLPLEVSLAFFGAALVLALAPGPDILFVLAQSALYGAKQGLAVSAGLCSGLLGHTALVACGVAALIAASPLCFALLKIAGAAYLAYLAWGAFRAQPADPERSAETTAQPRLSLSRLYCRGIVMNLTNPKVTVFFLAFLPQFTRPGCGPLWLQIVWLGALFLLAAALVFAAVALLAGRLGDRFRHSVRAQVFLNRAAAAIFAALALALLFPQKGA